MNKPLTVVLPMHNAECRIRSTIQDVLDLAVQMRVVLQLVVVDTGSTDETFESACELARKYPQLVVLRLPYRSGLTAVSDLVRSRVNTDMILLHDGVSPICLTELKYLLQEGQSCGTSQPTATETVQERNSGSRRFAAVRSLHESMESAHRKVTSFNWLKLEQPILPRRCQQPLAEANESTESTRKPIAQYLTNLPTGTPDLYNPR